MTSHSTKRRRAKRSSSGTRAADPPWVEDELFSGPTRATTRIGTGHTAQRGTRSNSPSRWRTPRAQYRRATASRIERRRSFGATSGDLRRTRVCGFCRRQGDRGTRKARRDLRAREDARRDRARHERTRLASSPTRHAGDRARERRAPDRAALDVRDVGQGNPGRHQVKPPSDIVRIIQSRRGRQSLPSIEAIVDCPCSAPTDRSSVSLDTTRRRASCICRRRRTRSPITHRATTHVRRQTESCSGVFRDFPFRGAV